MTDQHPSERDKQLERFAELERLIAAQDRASEEREAKYRERLADPRVRLGAAAVIRDNLDEYLGPAADGIAAAILALAERLAVLGLLSEENPGVPDYVADPLITGEMVPAIHAPDATYWLQGAQLMVQREHGGRIEYARVDEQGEPILPWRKAPPGRSRAASN
jgi:hypothetical protein